MADLAQLPPDPAIWIGNSGAMPATAKTTTIVSEQTAPAAVTIHPDGGSAEICVPRSAYSLHGFREWAKSDEFPERGQITFFPQGLIIDISPEALETHNYIKSDISFAINGLVRERKLGRFISDRVLYSNEGGGISTEPDAMFISRESLRSQRCVLVESSRRGINIEVAGSPDWILEVVSPSSVHKDKVILREGYFRAGVSEYWIVDALGDELEFDVFVAGVHGFVPVTDEGGWLKSPVFGCAFRLTSNKDEDGILEYTLHIQV